MENVELKSECEFVFPKDPIVLKQWVDKIVQVTTIDGSISIGRVYTFDPVSGSIVLFRAEDGNGICKVIMGHAVKRMELSSSDIHIPKTKLKDSAKVPNELKDSETNRVELKDWLLKNRVPVEEEENVLVVNKALRIYPPYGSAQCICSNSVMLDKVQHLISLMPKDK